MDDVVEIILRDMDGNQYGVILALVKFLRHHFGRPHLFNGIANDAKYARFTVDEVDLIHGEVSVSLSTISPPSSSGSVNLVDPKPQKRAMPSIGKLS